MSKLTAWIRRYRKWLVGLGAGYIALEIVAALLAMLGLFALKA